MPSLEISKSHKNTKLFLLFVQLIKKVVIDLVDEAHYMLQQMNKNIIIFLILCAINKNLDCN
jgi:hypothetical protein